MGKKLCPVCKKDEVNYLPWIGQFWECRNCGWRGVLVIEEGEEKPKKI